MPVLIDKSNGVINQVVLGATSETGGTRSHTITIGGTGSLPFLSYEGANPNRPIIAAEVIDREPTEWTDSLKAAWGDVLKNPVEWAKKAVEIGADIIYLRIESIDPDNGGRSVEDCAKTVGDILKAVSVPIAVAGCGVDELDKPLIAKIAEDYAGENLLIGLAKQENYATYAAACMVHKHTLIANSPLDINICKQLNILIGEMNMPLDLVVIDPSVGGLGYGLEYSYSVMERGRIGSLQGDKMLSMPVLGFVGQESWKAKEAGADIADFPQWGEQAERGILWETVTAAAFLQSGIDMLVMRHPDAMTATKEQIDEFMKPISA
jgi:acetyl-CoA decarbonylase/synthase complex subunit delta